MNGNSASGLRKGYAGPSLHGGTDADQNGIIPKGDFRQASHTNEKIRCRKDMNGQKDEQRITSSQFRHAVNSLCETISILPTDLTLISTSLPFISCYP